MRKGVRCAVGRSLIIALTLMAARGAGATAAELTVFAAASTVDAMTAVAEIFEREHGGRVRLSFAASSVLARQIESGAPADVYVSANRSWVDYLAKRSLLVSGSRRTVFGNRLVLIAPADGALALDIRPGFPLVEALGEGRLALGDPDHVPAGMYAREALERLGVWSEVAGRVARAADVRAAVALVARGEATAGIVYATDAQLSPLVRLVAAFPADSHSPILYEAALVMGHDRDVARRFLAALAEPAARAAFAGLGFTAAETD